MKKRLLLTLAAAFVIGAAMHAQENLLQNYQFDEGTGGGWTLGNWGGEATLLVDESGLLSGDNCASFEITTPGANVWDIQFFQAQIPVDEFETYYFSFMVSVDEEFELGFAWELEGEPYTKYWEETITLHPDSTHYKRTIVPAGTDEIANFKMFLGAASNDGKMMYLDSLVLSTDEFVYGEPGGTSVNIEKISPMRVYPNPAADYFTVEIGMDDLQVTSMDLYTITGQKAASLLEEVPVSKNFKQRFSTEELLPGTYFLRLNTSDGTVNQKLIIR